MQDDKVDSNFSSVDAYEELRTVYDEVLEDLENTTKKYFEIKKSSYKIISIEVNELKGINEKLLKEIEHLKKTPLSKTKKDCLLLKEEVKKLTTSLASFTRGEDGLNKLLGKQSVTLRKADLGFDFSSKGKDVEMLPSPYASTSLNPKAHVK